MGEEVEELNTNSSEASVTYDKPPHLRAQQHRHHPKTKYAKGLWTYEKDQENAEENLFRWQSQDKDEDSSDTRLNNRGFKR
ncbi:hypothetical protein GRJ2_001886600 [Grus japonensis]|uniref:Uncharacterized protein n=1 Tax=Grus japonensis TaxID=30415 RepID=A0ABC9X964_GRUJA